jgi:glutamate/tyrosine decarboxylase-like PLP-dependent enzyme
MARRLAKRLRETPGLDVWEPQGLSIVCFRAAGVSDERNRAALADVQLGGDAFLSGTVIDSRFWLRACIVNPRMTERDVDAVYSTVAGRLHSE